MAANAGKLQMKWRFELTEMWFQLNGKNVNNEGIMWKMETEKTLAFRGKTA